MSPAVVATVVVLAVALGGALGSYAGVVAARGWIGSLQGRSRCDSCGRQLNWFELVPIVSYLTLSGCCRGCRARIPFLVYAWELGGGLAAGAAASVVLLTVAR